MGVCRAGSRKGENGVSSIGEQIAQDQMDKAKKAAEKLSKPAGKGAYKGVCLIIKAGEFSTSTLMAAVKHCLYEKTGNIAYSNRNISVNALKKSGKISVVSEGITQENMRYFDKYCKEYGIKYSAMLDRRSPESPQYLVFFQSDNADIVMKALQEGYKDFSKAASRLGKMQGREAKSEDKDSVIGKLYSFRSRLEHSITNSTEKVKTHDDLAR